MRLNDGIGPCVRLNERLIEATFVSRVNRFLVQVDITTQSARSFSSTRVEAHIADPGRLKELLVPGSKVYLSPVINHSSRKTRFDVALIDHNGILVSIDSRVPNKLVYRALSSRQCGVPEDMFLGDATIVPEFKYGDSRLDFCVRNPTGECHLIEVKSVTLVQDGRALFPDAPTLRGARHARELARAMQRGLKASIIFVIQREDAQSFSANDVMDPEFGESLRMAARAGVSVQAYKCRVSLRKICLDEMIPVII